MKTIGDIDKNLKVESCLNLPGIKYYDPEEPPFKIYGVKGPKESGEGKFTRLPRDIAEKTNEGVLCLYGNTAGGRIRFTTDSSYVAIKVSSNQLCDMPHMTRTGSAGFSIYVNVGDCEIFCGSYQPNSKDYETVVHLGDHVIRDVILYMPLYNEVNTVYIGVEGNAQILPSPMYKNMVPVVYYGSSITQGGCASRPGMDYEGIVCRNLDRDYINLGFSGSARGEECMAEYISGLKMSAFVLDYDHNAPSGEHLEDTHEKFFKIIRKKNPELPIIIVTAPVKNKYACWTERAAIIKKTYDNAVNNGDKNVYFIEGEDFFPELVFNDATVDGCHPTDLGFFFMAKAITEVLKIAIKN